jgi:hypothetical protein
MANSRPTPLSFLQATKLCVLLVFNTKRFIELENEDNAARNNYNTDPGVTRPHSAEVVRSAFFKSFAMVVVSALFGWLASIGAEMAGWCATSSAVVYAQIIGASLLLWGTLFVRGWEIQSYAGVLLTERVNQWLYRALYCVGTGVLVFSVTFSACK